MTTQAAPGFLVAIVIVVVIGVAAFRHDNTSAERASKRYGQQHQCQGSFHTVPRSLVL